MCLLVIEFYLKTKEMCHRLVQEGDWSSLVLARPDAFAQRNRCGHILMIKS